ncbi:hypothetical protein BHU72_12345 [Desulfuribacillus stibiiarsenatis]|uniref:EamA domain-containing protein n=1 Tax=Desulfuribacillus stibiiarsenatis TaxID=1390249 RepID=A0A1E5L234_9FIRM|nr:DMT family transporter [Desulfuribacillus stibiiarsenatis]OEH84187.1 hypothetical protein BHU72_12345 [Desulfuribacillus stibiiarsenatis]
MKHKTLIADILLIIVAFIWGATFVIVKNAIDILPPFSFNAIRFFIASVFLLLIMLIFYRKPLKELNGSTWIAGFFIGVFLFAGYAFQTFGLLYTTASKAGFITGLSVVLVPLFAVLFFKEYIRRQFVIGISFAMVGLFLLSVNSNWNIAYGDFLVFLCAIAYALHIITVGKYAPTHNVFSLALIQISVVSLLNFIAAFLFEDLGQTFQMQTLMAPDVYWALLITAIFATALAFLVQTSAQKFTTPTKTALIFSTEPVFAAVTAFWLAGEVLVMREWIGCALILFGMIVAELPSSSEKKARVLIKQQNEIESEL